MSEPSFALQAAIYSALDPAQIGAAVYDAVPRDAAFPYVVLGDDQTITAHAECVTGAEVYSTIHVFSRLPGRAEVKRIAGAVVEALDGAELFLGPNLTSEARHHDSRFMTDADGLTAHGVLTFRSLVYPA